jgi:hypothetical protein
MRIDSVLRFNKECCFDGAVQSDWFYDENKAPQVAGSFVFHGPKYFGVSKSDIETTEHKLIDTASFAKELGRRLCDPSDATNLMMTIAGYGTGKSHLSVTLGELFSGHDKQAQQKVLEGIRAVDTEIANDLSDSCKRKNLVLVLNGMNNFNLDREVLACAQRALVQHGQDATILHELNKAHEIALQFVERTFELAQEKYINAARMHQINFADARQLQSNLQDNLETDPHAFAVVNSVYRELNGTDIPWERGISAGDTLLFLSKTVCGEGKPFNKILVLFDEFGRYLEYAATDPLVAGESALQQIFEAIQNSQGKIVFTGFIQSDLNTYMARVDKTSNIGRYIGRYERSDKYYLSSNYETILANLIQKKDEDSFRTMIENAIDARTSYYGKMSGRIERWNKRIANRSVWTEPEQFNQVIAKGCYPVHPMTVLILSGMSSWLQQRSTIAFVQEAFEKIKDKEIEKGKMLPCIYPYEIVTSSIYSDMLDSEEKGLVGSQYCLQYRDLMTKLGDKFTRTEKTVLQAILILNIGKFTFFDRAEANLGIELASGCSSDEIEEAIKSLEEMHGAISFDERTNQYDLIAEATGFNDFKRTVSHYKQNITNFRGIQDCDDVMTKVLGLDTPIATPFAQQHALSAFNWSYECRLMSILDLTEANVLAIINKLNRSHDGITPRGCVVYVYLTENARTMLPVATNVLKKLATSQYNILFILLEDDNTIINAMRVREILKTFSLEDKKKFAKYVEDQDRQQLRKIQHRFTELVKNRQCLTEAGKTEYTGTLRQLCLDQFTNHYGETVPFVFDGFEKAPTGAIRTLYTDVIMSLLSRFITDEQWYSGQGQALKTRIRAALFWDKTAQNSKGSWQCLSGSCLLVEPNNPLIYKLFLEVKDKLSSAEAVQLSDIFEKYYDKPYGMDDFALGLFVSYFLAILGPNILLFKSAKCDEEVKVRDLRTDLFSTAKGSSFFNIRQLLCIRIQLKGENYRDPIEAVCEKIAKNQSAEACEALSNELNRVLNMADGASVNGTMVSAARKRVENGLSLYSRLYSKIDDANKILEMCTEKFDLFRFLKVYVPISQFENAGTEHNSYVLSDVYLEKTRKISKQAAKMLDEQFDVFVDQLDCKLTGLDKLKENAENARNILLKIGKEEKAAALASRVNRISDALLARQKYESVIVKIHQYVVLQKANRKASYSDLKTTHDKLDAYKDYLQGLSDFPDTDKQTMLLELDEAREQINQRVEGRLQDVERVRRLINEFDGSKDAQAILSAVEDIEQQQISDECTREFAVYQSELEFYRENSVSLPDSRAALNDKQSNYTIKVKTPAIRNAIEQQLDQQGRALDQLQEKWLSIWKNKDYENMSAEELVVCQTNLSHVPAYIDEKGLAQIPEISDAINIYLAEKKIDGIVTIFKQLTTDEKDVCLQRLQLYK